MQPSFPPFSLSTTSLGILLYCHHPHTLSCFLLLNVVAHFLQTFEDLIEFKPSFAQVAKVVELLESDYLPVAHEMLTIKEMSQFRDVYHDEVAQIPPAKDDGANDNIGKFNKLPPYEDPFDSEPPLRPFYPDDIFESDEPPISMYRGMRSFLRGYRERNRKDESDPTYHMRSLEYSQVS